MRKFLLLIAVALAGTLTMSPTVAAHEEGESSDAGELVRQAIALIVNTPGDMEGIEDKIVDAQEATTRDGVDLALVTDARDALERGDMHEVRSLLERSIGAQPHRGNLDPLPIGETRGTPGMSMSTPMSMASGAESGTNVATDALGADRTVSAADVAGLVGLALLAGIGVVLALRFRPHPSPLEGGRP